MTDITKDIREHFHRLDANSIPASESNSEFPIDAITALDAEIAKAAQQYCQHSGKPLQKVDEKTLADLITIHGRKTTLNILYSHQRQVSLEWIWLNDTGLSNLSLHRPREYFVYTCSKLMQNCTIHSELMRLHEAATSWVALQDIAEDVLNPINELMRRLIGNYSLESLQKHLKKFKLKKTCYISASLDTLVQFELELANLLKRLLDKADKTKAIASGLQNFRVQLRITALSEMELEINAELNDYIDLESIKLPTHASNRMKRVQSDNKQAAKKAAAKPKFSGTANVQPANKLGGFKLNLGGKS